MHTTPLEKERSQASFSSSMEEFYESDIMWVDNHSINPASKTAAPGESYSSSWRMSKPTVPVTIPAARHRESHTNDYEVGIWTGELVPPHVMAPRSRMVEKVAFSLGSGQGRTLKGRYLRHVRDSVHRMTGFLEG